MDEYGLGPNGAMLYCIEYLEANFDWLVEQLDALLEDQGGNGYIVIDTPGQAELWTNHDSLKRIVERLAKMDYRVSGERKAVNLVRANTASSLLSTSRTRTPSPTRQSTFLRCCLRSAPCSSSRCRTLMC
jgi:GTPase SAR1 family protein